MRRHWLLIIGVISLLAWLAPGILKIDYDAGGVAGAFYWTCQILALPYWAISEVLGVLRPHPVLIAALGFSMFAAADWVLTRTVGRRLA